MHFIYLKYIFVLKYFSQWKWQQGYR